MKNYLLLSIIIPVYNVEKYVEKCLRSCAEQDIELSNYEIIVINDGTKDNSLAKVKKVAAEYSNIIVVSQENAGLSSARNKGLSLARGEYVWFIDSDDWIRPKCLGSVLVTLLEKNNDGLRILAENVENGVKKRRNDCSLLTKNNYSGIELLKTSLWEPCVPFTIYRRKFLKENNLKFVEGIFHEDSEFSPRAYYLAKKIAILKEIIYFVNIHPDSITRSINHKKAFDCIEVARNLSAFSKIVSSDLMYIFNNQISVNINNSLHYSYQMDNLVIQSLKTELAENKFLFKHLCKSSILKYRLEGILFSLFPRHCIQIYRFIQNFNKNRNV